MTGLPHVSVKTER